MEEGRDYILSLTFDRTETSQAGASLKAPKQQSVQYAKFRHNSRGRFLLKMSKVLKITIKGPFVLYKCFL